MFLPQNWLVDSGSDLNVCFNPEMFCAMTTPDISECTPVGSNPLEIRGKGIVRMCLGEMIDHNGIRHPIDLELEDVYYVPDCPINLMSTAVLSKQNVSLFTGPRGNELYMPGFATQYSAGDHAAE